MVGDIFWKGLYLGKQSEGITEFSTIRELLAWLSHKKVNKANYLSQHSRPALVSILLPDREGLKT